jgi:hypothetical protein
MSTAIFECRVDIKTGGASNDKFAEVRSSGVSLTDCDRLNSARVSAPTITKTRRFEQYLDCNGPIETGITDLIDFSHATRANGLDDR